MGEIHSIEQHKILDEIFYEQGVLFANFHLFVFVKLRDNNVAVYIFNQVGEIYGYGFCSYFDIFSDFKDKIFKDFQQICATRLYDKVELISKSNTEKPRNIQKKIRW